MMTEYRLRSASAEDTWRVAGLLAARLSPGCLIALEGDLGAGKTTFSQGFARALGVSDIVSSPTFTIIKEYEGAVCPFYHMDAYRLLPEEADELGLDDYFYGDGITVVEWSSRIVELLPTERLDVVLLRGDDGLDSRTIVLAPHGEDYEQACRETAAIVEGSVSR